MQLKPLIVSLTAIATLAVLVTILKTLGYGITYNHSNSMPEGYYLIIPTRTLHRNDIVIFKPSTKIAKFLTDNHLGPSNNLMLKYIVGLPGDTACKRHNTLWVNHKKIGPIHRYYAPNKLLPQESFCGKLTAGQYLLVSTKIPKSFDSRYFGPVNRSNILGKAYRFI